MHLIRSVLLCALILPTYGEWLKDLISPGGFDVGNGLILHLYDSQRTSSTSFLERHVIAMDYGGYGLSVTKAPEKDAVQLGIYSNGLTEGRGQKGDDYSVISIIMGYKLATVVAVTMSVVGALVIKALALAKLAAVASTGLLVSKLFGHHHEEAYHKIRTPAYVEIEHPPELHDGFNEISPSGTAEFHPSGSGNYYSYSNYIPSAMASTNYAAVSNSSIVANPQISNVSVARRRDTTRRTTKIPLLTIHQYTVKS